MIRQIEKIRGSGEAVRRRWFWGLSAIFAVIAIGLWSAYLQATLPKTKSAMAEVKTEQVVEKTDGESDFWGIFTRGFGEVTKDAGRGWATVSGEASRLFSQAWTLIQTERRVDLQPETELEFTPTPVEEVPPAELPAAGN